MAMVSAVGVLLTLGVVAGVALVVVGYRTHRMSERLGRWPFAAFVVVLGVGSVASGVGWFVSSPTPLSEEGLERLSRVLFVSWLLATVPWFVFAVRYTGTQIRSRPRTLALAGAPVLLIVADQLLSVLGSGNALLSVFAALVFLYVLFLAAVGTYLVVQKSYTYGHIRLGQGISLSIVLLAPIVLWNLIGAAGLGSLGSAGTYAGGVTFAAVGAGLALERYDAFESTPSIGTLGEQALTRQTDDLMVVVDDSDRIVTINETAIELLGVARDAAVGDPLQRCLGHDSDELRDAETVTVQTDEGARQYDPQVSFISDHRDNDIGATLSLRDVTERGLREQRLAVLNRVLRHNLRNELDVLKSHAETLDEDDAAVAPILEAADTIASLGDQARRIDRYVSGSTDDTVVDLTETVERVLDSVAADDAVDVSVETPASATLTTDRSAVVGALRSALDNAVRYAESAVGVAVEPRPNGYHIRVTDDGPGIPDWELESLDTGTESPLQHSTGLGLWQLKWAVRVLNGRLSFDTTEGTTVEIFVPDRADERTTT